MKKRNQTHNKKILYYNKPVKSKWIQIITELHLFNTSNTFLSGEDMCVQAAPGFLTLGSTCEKSTAHVNTFTTPDNVTYQDCFTSTRQTSKLS